MPYDSAKVDGTARVLVGAEFLWFGTCSFLHVCGPEQVQQG